MKDKPLADALAAKGRYGDSILVHMNPIEVAGLASLSPTGELTTNPDTGQPEAGTHGLRGHPPGYGRCAKHSRRSSRCLPRRRCD
jgi:hypothetical protein